MKTQWLLKLSRLLGGTWLLWLAAIYILGVKTILARFLPILTVYLTDATVAVVLIAAAVYQRAKKLAKKKIEEELEKQNSVFKFLSQLNNSQKK